MQESIDEQNTDFTSRLDQINHKIDEEIRDSIQNLKDSVDAEVLALNNRCDIVEKKIVRFEEYCNKQELFDPDTTVIVAGLKYEENEDIYDKSVALIQDGLGCHGRIHGIVCHQARSQAHLWTT